MLLLQQEARREAFMTQKKVLIEKFKTLRNNNKFEKGLHNLLEGALLPLHAVAQFFLPVKTSILLEMLKLELLFDLS